MKISLDDNCHVCISAARAPVCLYLPVRTALPWTPASY
jgi:hypothetical protein